MVHVSQGTNCVLRWRHLWKKECVARAQTAEANSRRGATKKREISRTFFSTNLHFLVEFLPLPARLQ